MSNVEGENVAGVTKVETSHGEVKIITYKSGELLIDIPDKDGLD